MLYTLTKVTKEALKEIKEEMEVRKTREIFLLFPLGSQFDHLIKQQLDNLGIFSLVADATSLTVEDVKKIKPKGILLSGGPVSVYEDPPSFNKRIFDLGIPVLGICLGFQLWAHYIEGCVTKAEKREFGTHEMKILGAHNSLFKNCNSRMNVLESHGDIVSTKGKIKALAFTENSPLAAGRYKHLWGVQFHPEVTETEFGPQIFHNFCFGICKAKDRFPAEREAERKIMWLREKVGSKKVLLALSGGSDSSTVAYLLKCALKEKGGQLYAVYIKGIDRPDDEAHVVKYFGGQEWITLNIVDATNDFLETLKGKISMKEKRIAMRGIYKRKLEEEAKKVGAHFITQGTLYTDISESGYGYSVGTKKAQIKIHHNVNLGFAFEELIPLSDCVKDNARNIGRFIGVPEELLTRHPFPGPGMVVRIEEEVTEEKLRIARQADQIYVEELRRWKLYHKVWQAGAVVTKSITTCTKGDDATNGIVIALWAVWSVNGFTARAAEMPWDFLKSVNRRMVNEIREVGNCVYRISDKPPTTIEWG